MKKLIAVLMSLCLLLGSVAAIAETANTGAAVVETANTESKDVFITPDVKFGMTADEVIKANGNAKYERDTENAIPGMKLDELEYENLEIMGVRAEVKYYFLNNKLIGVQVKFDDNTSMYNKMKEQLTEKMGEGVKPDANALGMAIYLADDDAKLEANSLAWIKDSTMAVLEQDDDDVKVTVVNLSDELTK